MAEPVPALQTVVQPAGMQTWLGEVPAQVPPGQQTAEVVPELQIKPFGQHVPLTQVSVALQQA
jgi:hypothetical protein